MKPVLQALLLAERVYQDKSGKMIIAGTFNKWQFKKDGLKPTTITVDGEERHLIPGGMQAGSPSVYLSLTEVRGEVDCVLQYVNLEHDKPLFQCRFKIRCEDPLQTVEASFPMPTLPSISGVHALELLCDDVLVGSHRITVEDTTEIEHDDDPNAE